MSFKIDKNHNLPIYSPICFWCKNFDKDNLNIPGKCKAFKKGIPVSIWVGNNKHLKPLPGQDNDIVFEKRK